MLLPLQLLLLYMRLCSPFVFFSKAICTRTHAHKKQKYLHTIPTSFVPCSYMRLPHLLLLINSIVYWSYTHMVKWTYLKWFIAHKMTITIKLWNNEIDCFLLRFVYVFQVFHHWFYFWLMTITVWLHNGNSSRDSSSSVCIIYLWIFFVYCAILDIHHWSDDLCNQMSWIMILMVQYGKKTERRVISLLLLLLLSSHHYYRYVDNCIFVGFIFFFCCKYYHASFHLHNKNEEGERSSTLPARRTAILMHLKIHDVHCVNNA